MTKTLDITRILREQKEQLRAGFQDRLVMTTSISLRKYDATACIIFTELGRWGAMSLLIGSTSYTPLGDRQDRLLGAECGYLRRRRAIPFDAYCTFFIGYSIVQRCDFLPPRNLKLACLFIITQIRSPVKGRRRKKAGAGKNLRGKTVYLLQFDRHYAIL